MPNLRRHASAAVVACLALVLLAGLAPGRASALEPPRPLPGHRPVFVTETDTRPWIDCLWASASMLLDKWTNGQVRASHQRLRRLSGDVAGGSSLEDLRVALRRLGFRIALDANGDSTMTWGGLLSRLRHGAGAVVLGDYGDLPRWYGRWDSRFWRGKGKQGNDNHALYVERYDARHGRVWVMDPLARGAYRGEWMSIWSLQRFAWFSGGRVQAIATPSAKPAPYKGVHLGAVRLEQSERSLTAVWPLQAPRRWRFPGADTHVAVEPADDPLGAAAAAATLASRHLAAGTNVPTKPRASVAGGTLRASTALPHEPGAYLVSLRLTDRRFGRRVAAMARVTVFVPGDRRAILTLRSVDQQLPAGGTMPVWLTVGNSGSATWVDPEKRSATARDLPRATRVMATWIPLDAHASPGDRRPSTAGALMAPGLRRTSVLRRVELGPGGSARFQAEVAVPGEPGRWALVIDVTDDIDGSFAALGSEPAVALYEVVGPSVARPAMLAVE